jgi:heme-NO-binding protein
MHGTIFSELHKFVMAEHGEAAWPLVLKQAGLEGRVYLPLAEYPDEEAQRLVAAASQVSGQPAPQVLRTFGEFIASDLLQMYWAVIQPEWKSLEVIEHTEDAIHRVVRLRDPKAKPPYLRAERKGPDEVVIDYTSPRRLCYLGEGIARGLGRLFGERLEVDQPRCTWKGDPGCLIRVRRLPTT